MARSRGQIRKRGPKKYLVRIYLGRIDGKRKYRSKVVNGTEKEAEKVLTRMLREKDRGTVTQPSTQGFDDFLDEWINFKKGKVAPATLRNYQKIIDAHLKPDLGHMKLRDLSTRVCQAFVDGLKNEKGLAHSYIQTIRVTLRTALQQAVKWNLLPVNPADSGRLELPKRDRDEEKERRVLSREQVTHLLEVTRGDRLHALWAILLATGLRPQEALALKWKDLDLDEGWMKVRRVVALADADTRQWHVTKNMKTPQSKREISLPEFVVEALDDHRSAQPEEILRAGGDYARNGFVFADESGDFLRVRFARRRFYEALDKAGLPDEIRLYDTRHTHISHLIEGGVDLKLASARAGHASIRTTADIYAHVSAEAEEKMSDAVQTMYAGNGTDG